MHQPPEDPSAISVRDHAVGPTAGAPAAVQLPAPVALGRTTVHPVTRQQALATVVAWAGAPRGELVVTPNVDHVVMLEHDDSFRRAYEASSLRLCDGMPLLVLSRLARTPLPERVTGADLFLEVCAAAAEEGRRVFIAGGRPEVLDRGMTALRAQFPALDVQGWSPPMFFEGTEHDRELQQRIARSGADIVMVCFGAPRSEVWAAQQQHRHPAVYLCVGAAIDFAAGTKKRSPRWMQRLGLEWAYRLLQEPTRLWRRYLVRDSAFLAVAGRQLWTSRRRPRVVDLTGPAPRRAASAHRRGRVAVLAAALAGLIAVAVWLAPGQEPPGREEAGPAEVTAPLPADPDGPDEPVTGTERELRSTGPSPLPAQDVLWSGSFAPAPGSTWEQEAGVTEASRTSADVVEVGPQGRDRVLRIAFGEDDSRWGMDYRHDFEAMGLSGQEEVYFSYDAYFAPDFEFIGDGKFGGLAGVAPGVEPLSASAGGDYDDDSFSVRAMWREDRSVVMYLYARHADGKDIEDRANYGYGIVEEFRNPDGSTAAAIEPGTWHRIEHRVVMNTPGENDGVYEMWIDGHRGISVTDVQYRTADHPELRVNNLFSAWFFGGDRSQFPTRVSEAYTDEWALTSSHRGVA